MPLQPPSPGPHLYPAQSEHRAGHWHGAGTGAVWLMGQTRMKAARALSPPQESGAQSASLPSSHPWGLPSHLHYLMRSSPLSLWSHPPLFCKKHKRGGKLFTNPQASWGLGHLLSKPLSGVQGAAYPKAASPMGHLQFGTFSWAQGPRTVIWRGFHPLMPRRSSHSSKVT